MICKSSELPQGPFAEVAGTRTRTLTRASIVAQVWKHGPEDPDATNIVDVYMAYLRKKLEMNDGPPMIHTIRGVGYIFRPESGGD